MSSDKDVSIQYGLTLLSVKKNPLAANYLQIGSFSLHNLKHVIQVEL